MGGTMSEMLWVVLIELFLHAPVAVIVLLLVVLYKCRPHGLKGYQAVVWGVSGMVLFYMYLPLTYTVLATASQSLSFNSEIERLRELCENGLFVVWGVMLLPFISRLMLLKGLGGEGYRGYLDNWAYVWGMWLACAYLGVWWLGYLSEWIWDFWWLAWLQQQGFQNLWGLRQTEYGVNSAIQHMFVNSMPVIVYLIGLLLCLHSPAHWKIRRKHSNRVMRARFKA